jgi:hypothetical protein
MSSYFNKNIILLTFLFYVSIIHGTKIHARTNGKFDINLHIQKENEIEYIKTLNTINDFALIQKTLDYTDLNLKKSISSTYVSSISIGNPPQTIPVFFDSGSGYTWVASKFCKFQTKQCELVNEFYNSELSQTYKNLNETLKIQFGKGELIGSFGQDDITLPGNLMIKNEYIGEIITIKENILLSNGMAGIIGLAYPESSLFNHTFYDGLIQSKLLTRNMIGFYYGKDGGSINFGYVDANKYKGKLNGHKVIDKYYWTLLLNDIQINGNSLKLCPSSCKVIIDTGSTPLIFPQGFYNEITNRIKVNKDCSNMKILPSIQFIINHIEYNLQSEFYVYRHYNHITRTFECTLNFLSMKIPRSDDNDTIVLGEGFIKSYYTVFDRDSDSVFLGIKNNS